MDPRPDQPRPADRWTRRHAGALLLGLGLFYLQGALFFGDEWTRRFGLWPVPVALWAIGVALIAWPRRR